MLHSSPSEDRKVYFDGLMALQLELQKKSLFNTNSAQLLNLDRLNDSASKLDEEEEVLFPFLLFLFVSFFHHLLRRAGQSWICSYHGVWKL